MSAGVGDWSISHAMPDFPLYIVNHLKGQVQSQEVTHQYPRVDHAFLLLFHSSSVPVVEEVHPVSTRQGSCCMPHI